jgi:hypothetical protein
MPISGLLLGRLAPAITPCGLSPGGIAMCQACCVNAQAEGEAIFWRGHRFLEVPLGLEARSTFSLLALFEKRYHRKTEFNKLPRECVFLSWDRYNASIAPRQFEKLGRILIANVEHAFRAVCETR